VCIKIPQGNNTVKMHGMNVKLDISFEPGKHVDVYGEVVSICDKLLYGKRLEGSMEHKTDIEVKVGDTVYFDYFVAIDALGYLADSVREDSDDYDIRYFVYNESLYIILDYGNLYATVRGDDVIMLNGHILVEPIKKEYEMAEYLTPAHRDMDDSFSGILRFAGSSNQEYLLDKYADSVCINVGDQIIFSKWNNQLLEQSIHSTFPWDGPLYKMQRKYVVGKIN
jgi:co-chaperonin GroES (HSP10)